MIDGLFKLDTRRSPMGKCVIFEDGMDGFVIHAEKCSLAGNPWMDGSKCIDRFTWQGIWPEWVKKPAPPAIKAPPLGLKPRFLVVEHRLDDIHQAITRYINAGMLPLQEWLDEKLELEEWLRQHRAQYKAGEKSAG